MLAVNYLPGIHWDMGKTDKLYAAVLSSPRSPIQFRDFERLLAAFGFNHARTSGSHRIYVHPAIGRPFPVQPDGKDAKRYQVREFLELVEEYGLYIAG
jgi:predicted RNA binding protein YcfA (HicA-like mRNA interferase family)